jgi:hypothetical protein
MPLLVLGQIFGRGQVLEQFLCVGAADGFEHNQCPVQAARRSAFAVGEPLGQQFYRVNRPIDQAGDGPVGRASILGIEVAPELVEQQPRELGPVRRRLRQDAPQVPQDSRGVVAAGHQTQPVGEEGDRVNGPVVAAQARYLKTAAGF